MLVDAVHALYGRSRTMLVALLATLGASVGASIACVHFAFDAMDYDGLGKCLVTSTPPSFVGVWCVCPVVHLEAIVDTELRNGRVTPIVFDTIVFLLTIAKFLQSRREGYGKQPVFDTVVRDGVWAYLVVFGTRFVSIHRRGHGTHAVLPALPATLLVNALMDSFTGHGLLIGLLYLYVHALHDCHA